MRTKPNVRRGDKNSGICKKHVNFGFRKEPLSSGKLGTYVFKPNVPDEIQESIEEEVSELACDMESAATHFITDREEEYTTFRKVQDTLNLPSLSENGLVTQLSVSVNHWARAHRDCDFFFTFLSCLSGKKEKSHDIIYYFCFPEHKIAVPLRSGDVIVFNPLFLHCCSNCQNDSSFIWSAYVSEKTVMPAGIGLLREG
jgi:hypothetical protein